MPTVPAMFAFDLTFLRECGIAPGDDFGVLPTAEEQIKIEALRARGWRVGRAGTGEWAASKVAEKKWLMDMGVAYDLYAK